MADIVYITAQDPDEDLMMTCHRSKPAKKIIVIRDDGSYGSEEWQIQCESTVQKIKRGVSYAGIMVEEVTAPYGSPLLLLKKVEETIMYEKGQGNEVYVNIGAGDKIVSTMLYVATIFAGGHPVSPKDYRSIELPQIPMVNIGEKSVRILKFLVKVGGASTLEELKNVVIGKGGKPSKSLAHYYIVNELAPYNLVETKRTGRKLKVVITDRGRTVALLAEAYIRALTRGMKAVGKPEMKIAAAPVTSEKTIAPNQLLE